MADKMLRIAGRGTDGTAKSIKVDNEGNLEIGNNLRYEREILLDNVSISAGENSSIISVQTKKAPIVLLFIVTDKQPWTLRMRRNFGIGMGQDAGWFYPPARNVTKTYTNASPFFCIPLVLNYIDNPGIEPASLRDALNLAVTDDFQVDFQNKSEETATVRIGVIRIWR